MKFFPNLALLALLLTSFSTEVGAQTGETERAEPIPIRADVNEPIELSPTELTHRRNLLIGYSAAIILASMLGGYLPSKVKLTHTRLQLLMSFVGGLMLGVALFHLLLHAIIDSPREDMPQVMTGVGLGIMLMFLLLRAFHFHQHDLSAESVAAPEILPELGCVPPSTHDHAHDHGHAHQHGHAHAAAAPSRRRFSWIGIALGLGLHSVMDGVALAASCLRTPSSGGEAALWGLGTFLAVLLHKPLDAVSITTVMAATGWKRSVCTTVNISFAVMCPVGAALAWWGLLGTHSHVLLISYLLAFSAGVFLCISLSDLLPEMQFHAHNQWGLTLSLFAGLLLAWGLMFLEPVHSL
ncbi:ZIP family metal transporter [Rubinisphaera margarita]|uniref:ZIP family metal transporter n=1 Tax=Rubinisphaera margarita TaxID=2909586 RepID=UPI001EE87616|nr:ZIP family metal transporter [Rubinisphaera margarita]MCG6154426.1 ZIP family metal transporter [Rubinisphaera margarita]